MVDVEKIMAYEDGEMTGEEIQDFFQGLIDSGLAWTLQGHYGRTANALINNGHCRRAGEAPAPDDGLSLSCDARDLLG
jgi:hypothetical protein